MAIVSITIIEGRDRGTRNRLALLAQLALRRNVSVERHRFVDVEPGERE